MSALDTPPSGEHIELDRRFLELTEDEQTSAEDLSAFRAWGIEPGSAWPELLESHRVVILAEAGSGKTSELKEQTRRLRAEGKAAFFFPVEDLQNQSVTDLLAFEPESRERFDAWLAQTGEPGWFFLDAVDELKLTQGKLYIALGRVAKALGAARDRARVFMTCRPSDWRPVQDLQEFRKYFPAPDPPALAVAEGDDPFLRAVDENPAPAPSLEEPAAKSRVVALLPLDEKQIVTFARHFVGDPDAFLAEIKRSDSLVFARRPLDLARLVSFWREHGRIGSRLEQHEDDVLHGLRENPDRVGGLQLSPQRAREGAERIALALSMTRKRRVRVQERTLESSDDRQVLDAAIALGWSEPDVAALLRLSIFDPATYGRVRFHHISVQEYLAARRLLRLMQDGMPRREVYHLLFPTRYGETVVPPSMRPLAAWLAIWDKDIRRELMAREPETLIQRGDPANLPIDARASLLTAFVESYGSKEWLGVDLPISEVRRLAHPDLADAIRSCWDKGSRNREVHELLLKMIWQARIEPCADIAFAAAMDERAEPFNRTLAVKAVEACGRTDLLREIAENLLAHSERWPPRAVFYAVPSLFPAALDPNELLTLLARTPEPKNTTGGFQWVLFDQVVPALEPASPAANELRDGLTNLILGGRNSKARSPHRLVTKFAYLAPALVRLSLAQIRAGTEDRTLLRAAATAIRSQGNNVTGRDDIKALKAELRSRRHLRAAIFETELAIVMELESFTTGRGLLFAVTSDGVLSDLGDQDWPWLAQMLENSADPLIRSAVAEALIPLWYARGKLATDREQLLAAVSSDSALVDHVASQTDPKPRPPNLEDEEYRREQRNWEKEAQERQRRITRQWENYRRMVQRDPVAAFSGERRDGSLAPAVQWLGFTSDGRSTITRHNWRQLGLVLGGDVAKGFERAAKEYWRSTSAPIVSKRTPEDENLVYPETEIALTGLAIESAAQEWPSGLTRSDVERAAQWATLEINGFPEWLADLFRADPPIVSEVLETEMRWELRVDASTQHPSVASAVEHAPDDVKRAMAPVVRAMLMAWPPPPADEPGRSNNIRNAQRLLKILEAVDAIDGRLAIELADRFRSEPASPLASTWLLGVFARSVSEGADLLRWAESALDQATFRSLGPGWLGIAFGEFDSSRVPVAIEAPAQIILDLIRYSYGLVRPKDDVVHDSGYTPGIRDNAQSARSRLLRALIEQPGHAAHSALVELSADPLMSHMADRMRLSARERAATDSEPRALGDGEFAGWERERARMPRNRDELYRTMLDRLEDIEHDTLHGDFNDRELLFEIVDEKLMQPRFAAKFEERSRGHYQVAREEEVADRKEPDIRLVAMGFAGKAAIELKIGDSWSIRELEEAIRDQLLGQYLRHESCSAGCLLVTYAGRKGFKHPETGAPMTFEEVKTHLQAYAARLERDEHGRVRLGVFGIDLRPPLRIAAKP